MRKPDIQKSLRVMSMLLGAAAGGGIAALAIRACERLEIFEGDVTGFGWVYLGVTGICAFLGWLLAPPIMARIAAWAGAVEASLRDRPVGQIISGAVGLILGLVIATLMTQIFRSALPGFLWMGGSALLYLMLGYLGLTLGSKRWREVIREIPEDGLTAQKLSRSEKKAIQATGKILDTSILIDGRIYDVCRTGFVEGPLLVPQFVLEELRRIADLADSTRRARGRRGLEMVAKMQKELEIGVQIIDADFPDTAEVDVKLLKLARQTGATVMTNDYNLNKVAQLSGMKVLNLNELAGALRMVLLPGEEMQVQILKEGKEPGQGVGYMGDGTMVVVDGGREFIGETVAVVITTALQTHAGRMIFTKLKSAE